MTTTKPAIIFVGAGRMGGALIAAMVGDVRVHYVDPAIADIAGAVRLQSLAEAAHVPGIMGMVVATKPAMVRETIRQARAHLPADAFILSIAAGVMLADMRASAGDDRPLIRLMPNLPALVGQGALLFASDQATTNALRTTIDTLFAPAGRCFWLDGDPLFDAVTALSGSGPAYFFRLAEAMARSGAALGLPLELAMQMAGATLAGAGALCSQGSLSLSDLRENVTSPGGTTAAALATFADGGIDILVDRAMQAAARRSVELSQV